MAYEAAAHSLEARWNGKVSPFGISHKKLGMWLFILSDSMTFAALLIAYGYVRVASGVWPAPFHFYPSIAGAAAMTVVLLTSGLTMAIAVDASRQRDSPRAVRYLLFTMIGGVAFIVLHAREWLNLFHDGVRLWDNPWHAPLFSGTFFAVTGMHIAHVLGGVIYLGFIAGGLARGKYGHDQVEVVGLYWHFVDVVWMFVFSLVYLLSVSRG